MGGWRPGMEATTPYGLWAATLLTSLYICFAVACTIPLVPSPADSRTPGRGEPAEFAGVAGHP
jgi:hypothetical protein